MNGHVSKPFDLETLVAAVLRAAVAGPIGNIFGPDVEPLPVPDASISAVIGADLPILAPEVFERTVSCLAPQAAASYLHSIAALGESIALVLHGADALTCNRDWLVESAHTVGGGAGLFGFLSLAETVQALASGSSEAPALVAALSAALDATLPKMRHRAAILATDSTAIEACRAVHALAPRIGRPTALALRASARGNRLWRMLCGRLLRQRGGRLAPREPEKRCATAIDQGSR